MTGRNRPPSKGRKKTDASSQERRSATRPAPAKGDAKPSKRAGRRPPGAVRRGETSTDEWRAKREGPARKHSAQRGGDRPRRPEREERRPERSGRPGDARSARDTRWEGRRPGASQPWRERKHKTNEGTKDGSVRLNRFVAQSGVCSRRDADDLIKAGVVTVNGQVVTELGTKVWPTDKVHYGGQRLSMEKKRYVLLNKPKDFITTTDDPRNRRTVMALVEKACPERIYPVGRLDRHTTGLLLMTNDGDLAKKLTHPSHGAEKIYHVTLDKAMTKAHLLQLVEGVELEDGPAQADEVNYVEGATKREVGIKIHMGRNRVVRRMCEALGYQVMKLDRVIFAGLTKKDLPRGKWRHLSEKELLFLTKRK